MDTAIQAFLAGGAVVIGATILVGIIAFVLLIKSLRFICGPNEVLIFSGRKHKLSDGSVRGFRVVQGGGWRVPVIEQVDRMNLSLMEVPISIRGAFSKGGIALNVDAIANVKISSDQLVIYNAIERFLRTDVNGIRRVAKETLEGHLRGVLSRLTPEEVNEDRLRFAEELSVESEHDLVKLGIHLDTLKILHVSDDRHYLESIGRGAIANVIKTAEMAESDAERDAELAEASNQTRGSIAKASAETNIAKMKNELRKIQADLEAQVKSEEERTLAAAREARAIAEQELQQIRAELETIRLQTDQVLPAEAQRVAQEFTARGQAAIHRERGTAMAQALEMMNSAWADAGDSALSMYILQDLDKILASAGKGVQKIKIDSLNMVDTGNGQVLSSYVASYPAMLGSIFDAISQTTGIDIAKAIANQPKELPTKAVVAGKEVPA
jgi:flotillin